VQVVHSVVVKVCIHFALELEVWQNGYRIVACYSGLYQTSPAAFIRRGNKFDVARLNDVVVVVAVVEVAEKIQ
jgi:hypothetical protein